MQRSFKVTLPADTNPYQLYGRLLLVAGAVPTDGVFPSMVRELTFIARGTLFLGDSNIANSVGVSFVTGGSLKKTSDRNSINLKDYYVKGNAGSEVFEVMIEAI
jgi:hypothetical protein